MHGYSRERGSVLILLIGITAALAILASTLVMVVVNQQRATATSRERKTSLYYAEAALDSAVAFAKTKANVSTHPMTSVPGTPWLTPAELLAAFPSGVFPPGATVTYRVYDGLRDHVGPGRADRTERTRPQHVDRSHRDHRGQVRQDEPRACAGQP
jgi:hypothetical protein